MIEWLLCPMVGEVVDNKAVIIHEIKNKTIKLYVQIEKEHKQLVHVNEIGPTKTILTFEYPTVYQIYWYLDDKIIYTHKIYNYPADKLIVVSCDYPEKDTKHSLWKTMENTIKNSNAIILHLGDQIYADKQYKICKKLQYNHLKTNYNDNELLEHYYNLYANRYHETYATHYNILSNTSNYYIWDDHELHNNVVINNKDNIDLMAIEAYKDYQQFQLKDDYIINDYCWYKYINDILIIVIERTSEHISIDKIKSAITLMMNNVSKIIISFTSAPIPPPHKLSGLIYKTINGINKFFEPNELLELLNWLFTMVPEKDIIMLGGDLHLGCIGFYKKEDKKIQVLVASPITNNPSIDRDIISNGYDGTIYLNDNIEFNIISSKAKRCYGVIDLNLFTTSIIYSKYTFKK